MMDFMEKVNNYVAGLNRIDRNAELNIIADELQAKICEEEDEDMALEYQEQWEEIQEQLNN